MRHEIQMRAQWASVPYILLKKDSRETGNLVIFDLDQGNSQRSENSVHYSTLCGSVLEATVEHFFFFLCFCSTFSSARIDFGLRGRTFFLFFLFLFYFQLRAARFIWRQDMRPRGTAVHGKRCFGTHDHSFLAVVQLHPNRSHQSPAFYPKGARMPTLL